MPQTEQTNSDPGQSDKNNKRTSHAGLWWILIAGGAFLVTLLFVSVYLPNLTERVKFFAVNALSILLLVTIAVQAYIYRRQWEVIERQEDVMRESLAETRNLIAQNERFSRINSRAYVFIDTASLDAPINSGKYPLAKIVVKNSGRSPAFNHRMRIEQAFLAGEALEKAKKGIMPKMRPLDKKGLAIIGAGHTTDMHLVRDTWKSPEDEELAMKGESVFYMWGLNCYSDIFGKEYSSKFSLFARNTRVTGLSFGLFGNDVEDEETEQQNPN